MNLLLDAHAFIWLDDAPKKLSASASKSCSDRANTLWLSTVTLWEIQIKFQIGKLKLRGSLSEVLRDQERINGLKHLALNSAHVLELANLPFFHNDPFDRMLIAQAKHEGWEIVSKDPEFKSYPVSVIW